MLCLTSKKYQSCNIAENYNPKIRRKVNQNQATSGTFLKNSMLGVLNSYYIPYVQKLIGNIEHVKQRHGRHKKDWNWTSKDKNHNVWN